MYCGKCGAKVPDGYEFCMKCGAKLEHVVDEGNATEKKKGNKKPIIPILVCVVIAVCVVVGVLLFSQKAGGNGVVEKIKWGTDLDVASDMIEKQYPKCEFVDVEKEDLITYRISDYNGLKGVDGVIGLYFDSDNAVCKITEILQPGDNSDYTDEGALYDEYIKKMDKKYGESDVDSYGVTHTWTTSDSEIKLSNIDGMTILISYKPAE